jgi:ribonucrease Y
MGSLTLLIGISAAAILVGVLVGWLLNSSLGTRSLADARREAEELVRQARQDAEHQIKQAGLAAREEVQKARSRFEQEARQRQDALKRQEGALKEQEQRLAERQADLAQRETDLTARLEAVTARDAEIVLSQARLEAAIEAEQARLEQAASMSRVDARRMVLDRARKGARLEIARTVKEMREEAQKQSEAEAQNIMALAIERTAADFSTNKTTAAVLLADDKMKGRIIGQDGKNIKAFEAATGLQLIVDETPGQVTLSGFHPIRREIARLSLERLLKDGNIHPRRIDETVRKMRRQTLNTMRRAAEDALKELKIRRVHPEMVNLLGRLRFRTSYGQNVLEHSMEVAWLSGIMATELGLDEMLARRAGLLHDIGKAIDYEREGTHPEIGEEIGRRYGEHEIVVNAIASHHEDCEPISPISILVAAADALSGARPGARRKTLADFIRRVEKLEGIAMSLEGVTQAYAIQAGRELRVIARHDKVSDEETALLATDIAHRIQAEVDYPGKIKVTVIREMWATAYAR